MRLRNWAASLGFSHKLVASRVVDLRVTDEVSCVVRLGFAEGALILDTRVQSALVRGQKRTVAASELRQGCSATGYEGTWTRSLTT